MTKYIWSGCLGIGLALFACAAPPTPLENERTEAGGFEIPVVSGDVAKNDTGTLPPVEPQTVKKLPTPPWQVWTEATFGNPELELARQYAQSGQFHEAVQVYAELQRRASNKRFQDEAFIRRIGTMLKLGQSREVLSEVSRYLSAEQRDLTNSGSRIAFIVSFAYRHLGDLDQQLAWLSAAHSQSKGEVATRAAARALLTLRELDDATLEEKSLTWKTDPFIGPLLSREQIRRSRGEPAQTLAEPNWFVKETYLDPTLAVNETSNTLEPANVALVPVAAATPMGTEADSTLQTYTGTDKVVGTILPLSGPYREHALRVQRGIELALEQLGNNKIRLAVADSDDDPILSAQAFEQLTSSYQISGMLGPLLSRTTIAVAPKAEASSIPFIAFTKRPGIPELSPYAFRLGATANDQVRDLVWYAVKKLKLNRLAVLSPQGEVADDFRSAFEAEAGKMASVVYSGNYQSGVEASIDEAFNELLLNPPDALFIPDTLDGALPIVERLRSAGLDSITLLGSALWDDPALLHVYSAQLEGAVLVSPFYSRSTRQAVIDFNNSYRTKYDTDADLLSAQAYDATRLLLRALASSDEVSTQQSLSALAPVMGLTGRLSIADNGEVVRQMSVLRVKDGALYEAAFGGRSTAGDHANSRTLPSNITTGIDG